MTPGSDEAITLGCSCSAPANNHGHGQLIGGKVVYWRDMDCQLHGEAEVIELSIETA